MSIAKLYSFILKDDVTADIVSIAATSEEEAVDIFKKWYKALQDQDGDDTWTDQMLSDSLELKSSPDGVNYMGYPVSVSPFI